MKKILIISCYCLLLLVLSDCIPVLAQAQYDLSDSEILQASGMPQAEIDSLDNDIKEFIINDLRKNANLSDLKYIDIDIYNTILPMVNDVFYDITFYVSAFKSGNVIYIYPTYEFTADHRPRGRDSFSFQLGNAMMPYNYGGQLWYKDYSMQNWAVAGSLTANNQGFNGAEYSGSQLGSPDWSMKFRGSTFVHAQVGSGTDKRIIMSYMHNPNRHSYSIAFSIGGVGITYNSSGTVYTNARTVILSY